MRVWHDRRLPLVLQQLVGVDVGGDDDVFGYGELFETAADVGREFTDGFGSHHEVEAVLVVRFREWCDAGFAENGVGGQTLGEAAVDLVGGEGG